MLAGTSGIAASFSWLEPARPYLAGVTVAALGLAWYQRLFPGKSAQDCVCETSPKVSFWKSRTFLSIITLFTLGLLSFPHYAHVFYPHSERHVLVVDSRHVQTIQFEISGMTCQGCAEHVLFELNKLTGILKSDVSYESGRAVVEFDKSSISAEQIAEAINTTGYTVERISEIPN
jgi:copper chaperone CopZ